MHTVILLLACSLAEPQPCRVYILVICCLNSISPGQPASHTQLACAVSVCQVMSLVCDSQASGAAEELTGPGDPLRLTIARDLDLEAGTLSLSLSISNRLNAEIKNIVVR